MKIGVSLSPDILVGNPVITEEKILLNAFHGIGGLLSEIKSRGVSYIELRVVKPEHDPQQVIKAAEAVWYAGMNISIHGKLTLGDEYISFDDLYPSLKKVFSDFSHYQKKLVIVIHAFTSQEKPTEELAEMSVGTLNRWVSLLGNNSVKFAVEINRAKEGRNDPCTTCEGVLGIIDALRSPQFGICWDMGHVYYNVNQGFMTSTIPEGFLAGVSHTHIHGVGEKGTHCTLTRSESLPLKEYIRMLNMSGYNGIFNLEFSFEKFPGDTLCTEFFKSIEKLSKYLNS